MNRVRGKVKGGGRLCMEEGTQGGNFQDGEGNEGRKRGGIPSTLDTQVLIEQKS